MSSFSTTQRPTIRAVQSGDSQLVRDVYVEILLDSLDAFGVTLAEVQGRGPSERSAFVERCAGATDRSAFLAEDNLGVCGFVRGDTSDPRTPPETVLVSELWVAPRQRKTGLGRELMSVVTKWAEERRSVRISLGVAESNLGVQKFYERLGYADTGIRVPLPSNPTLRVVVMAKGLEPTSRLIPMAPRA